MVKVFLIFFLIVLAICVGKCKLLNANKKNKMWIAISIVFCVVLLCIIGSDTIHFGNYSITEKKMQVNYYRTNREFYNRIKLGKSKKIEISSSSKSGEIMLTVKQNEIQNQYDISNYSGTIYLEGFQVGYVNLKLSNTNARNVKIIIKNGN